MLGPTGAVIAQFFNTDARVVAIASTYLWMVPVTYGTAGIIQVASSAFNALGRPMPSVVMTVVRMLVLYIPLAYLGSRLFGAPGIFAATAISNLVVGVGAYVWNMHTCLGKMQLT